MPGGEKRTGLVLLEWHVTYAEGCEETGTMPTVSFKIKLGDRS